VNCLRAEELLSDYREGELHEILRGELEAHLSSCAECPRLLAALDEVLGLLQVTRARLAPGEIEPAGGLAARAAEAALAAGRTASAPRRWRPVLPARVQTLAAGVAFFATATVLAGRTALERRWPQRLVSEAATAGVHVIERKDRALEDLRVLRVIVGATFEGRVDRMTERVDDYRRLLERRRSGSPGGQGQSMNRGGGGNVREG
jgi:anti-sigma factor RsiW